MNKQILYNNFESLSQFENVNYHKDDKQTQFIELTTENGIIIQITIPVGIFEWFVEVLDIKRNKLHSDWTEHYGNPKEILYIERQNDIEDFVKNILNGKLHFDGTSLLDEFYKNK